MLSTIITIFGMHYLWPGIRFKAAFYVHFVLLNTMYWHDSSSGSLTWDSTVYSFPTHYVLIAVWDTTQSAKFTCAKSLKFCQSAKKTCSKVFLVYSMGSSIKYVRNWGGRGSEIFWEYAYACTFTLYKATIFCVQGEGGPKIGLFVRAYFMDGPYIHKFPELLWPSAHPTWVHTKLMKTWNIHWGDRLHILRLSILNECLYCILCCISL